MSDDKKQWRALMKAWRVGVASQLEHARRYTADHPKRFEGWVALADAMWSMARYREARAALERADRLVSPKVRYRVCAQWGHFYKQKGDLKSATRWYRKAIAAKPSTGRHVFLGAVLARQGSYAEAKAQYRAAIRLASDEDPIDEAHYNLALVLRAEEKYGEAARQLQHALSIDPDYKLAKEILKDVRLAMAFVTRNKSRRARRRVR